jgi:hypothetical protein
VPQFSASAAGICNVALRHLGIGKRILSLTEAGNENAAACAQFYDQTRDEVLHEFNWPFARRYAALALVGGTTSIPVTLDWQYSFRVPADCLSPRRILSGSRIETELTRVPFAVGSDAVGGLLFTDQPFVAATDTVPALPQLEYTAAITTEARFSADFAQAMALKLAFYIAPSVTGGDPNKLGARAFQLYDRALAIAENTAANEQQRDQAPDSEFIRARY